MFPSTECFGTNICSIIWQLWGWTICPTALGRGGKQSNIHIVHWSRSRIQWCLYRRLRICIWEALASHLLMLYFCCKYVKLGNVLLWNSITVFLQNLNMQHCSTKKSWNTRLETYICWIGKVDTKLESWYETWKLIRNFRSEREDVCCPLSSVWWISFGIQIKTIVGVIFNIKKIKKAPLKSGAIFFLSFFRGCFGVAGSALISQILLISTVGTLSWGSFRDFHPSIQPNPLIAFEHLSLYVQQF